jgi:hypothetical protein
LVIVLLDFVQFNFYIKIGIDLDRFALLTEVAIEIVLLDSTRIDNQSGEIVIKDNY